VSKLRENAKTVIGVGVKNSTSDLFINNCDQFLYYDDLVRAEPSKTRRRTTTNATTATNAVAKTAAPVAASLSVEKALDLLMETLEALAEEREEDEDIWGSMIKQTIKRRNPGFNERAYGFRSFYELLLEAKKRGLVTLEADEKSGGYMVRAVE
jgi:hypothetical protein